MRKEYHKLVRDKIPEIIRIQRKTAMVSTLSDTDYRIQLHHKLQEEVDEYLEHPCAEEICDILEVLYAMADTIGLSPMQLDALRRQKAEERGGFSHRQFLHYVVVENE